MNDWKIQNLSEIIPKAISGEWGDDIGETKILRTTNFQNDGTINYLNVVKRSISQKKIDQKALKFGDTIIEKSGGSPTQPVGRVVYFDKKDDIFLCNNFTSILRPSSSVDSKYVFWFLFNNHLTGKTLNYQNKTTGIINLKLERYLQELQISVPPPQIQKRIAEVLDKADNLRKKDKEQLRYYDDLAQSLFVKIFGDPIRNEKGWITKPIKELGKVTTGNTPKREVKDYYGNFIEWIKTDNISHQNIDLTIASEYLSEKGAKVGRWVESGSVLVTCIAGSIRSIGNVALSNRRVAFNQQINAFTPFEISGLFSYFLFKYCKPLFQQSATNGMKRIITKGEFEKIHIISPPLSLQKEFELLFHNIITQTRKAKLQSQESENLFQVLLQQAFNGSLN